jgi:membrane-bound lytic murein transglycosylase B
MDGSIVLPGGSNGPVYLVYENFRVTMKWNRSQYFAISVGLLADAIGS